MSNLWGRSNHKDYDLFSFFTNGPSGSWNGISKPDRREALLTGIKDYSNGFDNIDIDTTTKTNFYINTPNLDTCAKICILIDKKRELEDQKRANGANLPNDYDDPFHLISCGGFSYQENDGHCFIAHRWVMPNQCSRDDNCTCIDENDADCCVQPYQNSDGCKKYRRRTDGDLQSTLSSYHVGFKL